MSSAPGMGDSLLYEKRQSEKVTNNRREAQAAEGDQSSEGSVEQRHDRMNKNRLRGLWWAMSILLNAKSNKSPKDTMGRDGRHGSKAIAPYPGRAPL